MANTMSSGNAASISSHEIDGFLDAVSGSALSASVTQAIERGADSLLLDLSAVERLDVPGLASVVASSLAAARANISLSIRMPIAREPRVLLDQAALPSRPAAGAISR